MTEERRNEFKNLTYEEITQLRSVDFTVSELKEIIAESVLSDKDRELAVMRYIELKTIEDIVDISLLSKNTVLKHLKSIHNQFFNTLIRLCK